MRLCFGRLNSSLVVPPISVSTVTFAEENGDETKMGASSSTEHVSREQQEVEALAASTGALPMLQKAFAKLADPQTNAIPLKSLQECFNLILENPISEASPLPERFPGLLSELGSSVVDQFFRADKEGVHWIEFLRGYISCCGRMSSSMTFDALFRVYASASEKSGFPLKLEFESYDSDSKITGFLSSTDLLMLLWVCWIMAWSSRFLKPSEEKKKVDLPDISHLILSAIVSCTEDRSDMNVWDCNILGLEIEIPAGKLHMWALTTVPSLANCFTQYVHGRLQKCATAEDEVKSTYLSVGNISLTEAHDTSLLTCGRAWAISLTLRSALSEELLRLCFGRDEDGTCENLLYRSSTHGKGLNRFWSNIEGYHGPMLIVVSGIPGHVHHDNNNNNKKWVIGMLKQEGFENRNDFYGSYGYLYAISPIFHVFSPSGKEKNFVYSHLHSSGYEPHPKPVGVAFGGTIGNERIFIDEDFSRITLRHHATDKTYQHGSLIPNQGFLPFEAMVLVVEVWGLGGKAVKEQQSMYKNREQLFTEQRRKVDLKTLGNWEDSPEKMMMNMVSDPNAARREER